MIAPSREGSNVQILCLLFRLHLFEICILLNQQRGSFLLCSAEWTCDGSLVTIVKKGSLVIDRLELLLEEERLRFVVKFHIVHEPGELLISKLRVVLGGGAKKATSAFLFLRVGFLG